MRREILTERTLDNVAGDYFLATDLGVDQNSRRKHLDGHRCIFHILGVHLQLTSDNDFSCSSSDGMGSPPFPANQRHAIARVV